jgi:hypothetical protein
MRQLGNGQSLVFFAPLEIDRAMKKAAGKTDSDVIETIDILRWCMLETCQDIEHHLPHWAYQGLDYVRRRDALKGVSSQGSRRSLIKAWRKTEARSLEQLYGIGTRLDGESQAIFAVPELADHLRSLGVEKLGRIDMDEEQEREVDHEAEIERQVERPPEAQPFEHAVTDDLKVLIKSGRYVKSPKSFRQVFKLVSQAPQSVWAENLVATTDFVRTTQITLTVNASNAGDFYKPVHWLLSAQVRSQYIVIILSGYEVKELLPLIRESRHVHLHVYSAKVIQDMPSFEDLQFYCIPPLPPTWTMPNHRILNQLNLFAGQLYLKDYDTYLAVREFLGLYTEVGQRRRSRNQSQTRPITNIQADGFVLPGDRQDNKPFSPFNTSPIPFLKEWMTIRRKGQLYMPTHMGRLLHARQLTKDDFREVR